MFFKIKSRGFTDFFTYSCGISLAIAPKYRGFDQLFLIVNFFLTLHGVIGIITETLKAQLKAHYDYGISSTYNP